VAGREEPAGVNPMGGWPEEPKPVRSVLTCGTASVNQAGRAMLAAAADRKRNRGRGDAGALRRCRSLRTGTTRARRFSRHQWTGGNEFRELIRVLERQHQAADRAEKRRARGQAKMQRKPAPGRELGTGKPNPRKG
jgi:hypothetical protein